MSEPDTTIPSVDKPVQGDAGVRLAEAMAQLRTRRDQYDDTGQRVGVREDDLDVVLDAVSGLNSELLLLNDRALRMECALRFVRTKALGDVVDPESGILRAWLKDWIDGFDNGVVRHGPIGGPMLWPAAAPGMVRQLLLWGFSPVKGPHGIDYAVLKRAPDAGEAVQ